MQPLFAGCKYFSHEGSSHSEGIFQEGICLPSGSNLTESQQDRVIEVLDSLLRR